MSGPKPIGPKTFIVPLGPSPLGGDLHETFNVDKDGNLRDGHTTVRIKGGKKVRIDHRK